MAAVLERTELEASPLADLHAIADQLGLDGFRRLRKAELIDRILGEQPSDDAPADDSPDGDSESSSRSRPRRRGGRSRRSASSRGAADAADEETQPDEAEQAEESDDAPEAPRAKRRGRTRAERASAKDSESRDADDATDDDADSKGSVAKPPRGSDASAAKGSRARGGKAAKGADDGDSGELAEGVVEVLGNGSAFLRIDPPEPSDGDVYISAAQVRRCELVSGDKVTGPVRTPRRSERYPSLVRIDTINGASADEVSAGTRFEDLPVDYPSERFALESKDATLQAIEWLTPFGRGSRVLIVGAARAGKTETLRGLRDALSASKELEVSLVLAGARPEEISSWQDGGSEPVAALSFAASADTQAQAVERAIDAGKRVAARGGHAVVLIDGLDGVPPHAARKTLAAARNLREGGSLTIVATATQPFGGESTVIALDATLTSTGTQPILDLAASGTLKPELLVGKDGAKAIAKARASALEG
ncbi:MAG TPA: Rho termination factor N-terminal domain-containing protein [Solirubrobacteraceae bacterium]|nr:Rho termination factor N-terminal domain-containing protein [Solirubrobacteraceae bacterium]